MYRDCVDLRRRGAAGGGCRYKRGATRPHKAIEALKQVNAQVIGVTLNRIPRSSGYYYHYRYESSSDASPVQHNGLICAEGC